MRVLLMHHTSPHWEAGAPPGPALVGRVGRLLGEMAEAGVLRGAEGLRASALGARLRVAGGGFTVAPGPLPGVNELPAGFAILRVRSLDEAVAWASRFAALWGDVEVDVRPLTEPWDLGMEPPPPEPAARRFMALRKADAASEAGIPPAPEQSRALRRLLGEARRAGLLLVSEGLLPSSRGVRYRFEGRGHTVTDGPFAESKELLGGYVILDVPSLAEARAWAPRYAAVVGCPSLDLRPMVEEQSPQW